MSAPERPASSMPTSAFVRAALVRPGGGLLFQADSQRRDLINESSTRSELVALLTFLVKRGHVIEITAIKADHHDDSSLGVAPLCEGTHAHGWAADCWPLASHTAGDYLDAAHPRFQAFLFDCARAPYLKQIGLAGSAWTPANRHASGATVFEDGGGDHAHLGTHETKSA